MAFHTHPDTEKSERLYCIRNTQTQREGDRRRCAPEKSLLSTENLDSGSGVLGEVCETASVGDKTSTDEFAWKEEKALAAT